MSGESEEGWFKFHAKGLAIGRDGSKVGSFMLFG